ncbi:MAG TPA: type II toxin-antitoxin system YafQ family toxin [Bacteroidota bacterium]|nr:type II toxin-antitoxin system YafQ family toxin [Bacteroidota bacterium]
MTRVTFSTSFRRAKRKRIDVDRTTEERFWEAVQVFMHDPFDPRLRTHKLSGKLEGLWSFSVEFDVRVIFYFTEKDEAVFVDVGSHDEVY